MGLASSFFGDQAELKTAATVEALTLATVEASTLATVEA